jgi:hypothetical protein
MYRYPILITSLLICILLTGNSCKKKNDTCHYYNPPSSLRFLLRNNGAQLPDSILTYLKISYYDTKGTKQYLSDLVHATDDWANTGILGTRAIGTVSGDRGIKTYYLEYRNGTVDTLYVDYSERSPATNCFYVLKEVRYNGRKADTDTNYIKIAPVYDFDKP